MNKIFFFALLFATCFTACKKDTATNTTVTKKIKKIISTYSGSRFKNTAYFYYDANDNLIRSVTIRADTANSPIYYDTSQVVTFNYLNSLPSSYTIKTYEVWRSSIFTGTLINTYNRQYTFNGQNQITNDSLISYNLQNPYSSPYAYKDTISYLTNKQYTYSGTTQYINSYNSPLLNNSYLWQKDTLYYTNNNLTQKNSINYENSYFTTNYSSTMTYTNYTNPLYFGLIPIFGQSKNLVNTEVTTFPTGSETITYQYTFDTNSTLIKSVSNSTGSSSWTAVYEYYQ